MSSKTKNILVHAIVEIIDRVEHTHFWAYRQLSGDDANMAHAFARATDRAHRLRLDGGSFYLSLNRTDMGTRFVPIDPSRKSVRGAARHFVVEFVHGEKPQLTVYDRFGDKRIALKTSLYGFCTDFDEITNTEIQKRLASRAGQLERQRERRARRAAEREELKTESAHAATLRSKRDPDKVKRDQEELDRMLAGDSITLKKKGKR